LREADRDCYKIDLDLFAPAVLIINNVITGKTFGAEKIDAGILIKSLGF
jgi:methenyltetrahydromethanopterin cyclohydrolase